MSEAKKINEDIDEIDDDADDEATMLMSLQQMRDMAQDAPSEESSDVVEEDDEDSDVIDLEADLEDELDESEESMAAEPAPPSTPLPPIEAEKDTLEEDLVDDELDELDEDDELDELDDLDGELDEDDDELEEDDETEDEYEDELDDDSEEEDDEDDDDDPTSGGFQIDMDPELTGEDEEAEAALAEVEEMKAKLAKYSGVEQDDDIQRRLAEKRKARKEKKDDTTGGHELPPDFMNDVDEDFVPAPPTNSHGATIEELTRQKELEDEIKRQQEMIATLQKSILKAREGNSPNETKEIPASAGGELTVKSKVMMIIMGVLEILKLTVPAGAVAYFLIYQNKEGVGLKAIENISTMDPFKVEVGLGLIKAHGDEQMKTYYYNLVKTKVRDQIEKAWQDDPHFDVYSRWSILHDLRTYSFKDGGLDLKEMISRNHKKYLNEFRDFYDSFYDKEMKLKEGDKRFQSTLREANIFLTQNECLKANDKFEKVKGIFGESMAAHYGLQISFFCAFDNGPVKVLDHFRKKQALSRWEYYKRIEEKGESLVQPAIKTVVKKLPQKDAVKRVPASSRSQKKRSKRRSRRNKNKR